MTEKQKILSVQRGTKRDVAKIIVIAQDTKRLLIEKRTNTPGIMNPGKWSALGGNIEINETVQEGAIREIYEESGIRVTHLEEIDSITQEEPNGLTIIHYFFTILTEEQPVRSSAESERLEWHTLNELLTMDITSNLRNMLQTHRERIEKAAQR